MGRLDLTGAWEVRCPTPGAPREWALWLPASVPGTIHTDLLAAELIPDPFHADNELLVQRVHEVDWLYRRFFEWKRSSGRVQLVCEGLDTVAEIRLNGWLVGQAEDQFLPCRLDVTEFLTDGTNCLEIHFRSPLVSAAEKREQVGRLVPGVPEYDELRYYLRKAQYSFGWDWGPCLPTCGIWRPIYLVWGNSPRISDAWIRTLEISGDRVRCALEAELEDADGCRLQVELTRSGQVVVAEEIPAASARLRREWELRGVELWWPNGHGSPSLYELTLRLRRAGRVVHEVGRRVGFRTLELLHEDASGPCFRLRVNGREIFAKGANWIPADSFVPRVSAEKYRFLLERAARAHMNVLRVWGGGIYENDIFYDLCDELGLLVWQDFMFACGVYPETEEFLALVEKEARANVRRLRHHVCLALWCGNNECEWIWRQRTGRPVGEMPGFRIFHELLPRICSELDPGRPYWPTSPWGEAEDPNSERVGNRHQWEIWSGWKDYREVRQDRSLFVTEFGFQAPACQPTLDAVLPAEDRHPQSRLFEFHNKQPEGPERLFRFLAGHLRVDVDYARFIYLAQVNQGEALRECIEHWRRRWPQTAGALIWQLNDCWPVTSWSLIDSELRPKAAYYYVKRAFTPVLVSVQRGKNELKLWVCNDRPEPFLGELVWQVRDFLGAILREGQFAVEIEGFSSAEVASIDISQLPGARLADLYLSAKLFDGSSREIHRAACLLVEPKHANLPEPQLRVEKLEVNDGSGALAISSRAFAKAVRIQLPGAELEDNFFDLEPGETRIVSFRAERGLTPDLAGVEIVWLK